MDTADRRTPPTGLLRLVARLPIQLFRLRLGWTLGNRFLLLTHTGRTSGTRRQAVVEVVDHDPTDDSYVIAAGFGPRTNWYRNLLQTPNATIQTGRRTLAVTAIPLRPDARPVPGLRRRRIRRRFPRHRPPDPIRQATAPPQHPDALPGRPGAQQHRQPRPTGLDPPPGTPGDLLADRPCDPHN